MLKQCIKSAKTKLVKRRDLVIKFKVVGIRVAITRNPASVFCQTITTVIKRPVAKRSAKSCENHVPTARGESVRGFEGDGFVLLKDYALEV